MRGVGDDKDITSPYGQINFNDTTKILQTLSFASTNQARSYSVVLHIINSWLEQME